MDPEDGDVSTISSGMEEPDFVNTMVTTTTTSAMGVKESDSTRKRSMESNLPDLGCFLFIQELFGLIRI